MPIDNKQYMTPQEVADLLRVPIATLYAWRYKGEGPPASRIGRHLRYRQSAVEKWFDEQQKQAR